MNEAKKIIDYYVTDPAPAIPRNYKIQLDKQGIFFFLTNNDVSFNRRERRTLAVHTDRCRFKSTRILIFFFRITLSYTH